MLTRRATTTVLLIGLPIVCVAITVIVGLRLVDGDRFEKVADACEVAEAPEVVAVGDDGGSLTVSALGNPEAATTASMCVLDRLEAPDSVMAKVDDTTAMQGRTNDSWDGVKVSWTYRPDDGLSLIVEKD